MTTEAFEGTNNQQPQSRPSQPRYWSEAIRKRSRSNNPPVVTFLVHLAIGLFLVVLLGLPFLLLQLEARRGIAFLATNGNLMLTQADPKPGVRVINNPPQQPSTLAANRLANIAPLPGLPTAGLPVWATNGMYLATTAWQDDGTLKPQIYNSNFQNVAQIDSPNNILAVPADGWSKDGTILALVEFDGARPLLTLVAPPFNVPVFFDFSLDSRAGIDWHPSQADLLVTGFTDESPTPQLFLVNTADNEPQLFSPSDGLSWRADGAWSPDGSQVAYIAGDIYTPTQNILAGTLWVVNSNGGGVRQLEPHRRVIAPVWSPDGTFIYYTLFSAPSSQFALYRIPADGSTPPEYIGPSSENILRYAWDRSLLFQWSPNNKELLFVGGDIVPPDYYLSQSPTLLDLGLTETELPAVGAAVMSPNNEKFAGTIITAEGIQAVIFPTLDSQPALPVSSDDDMVIPADGWSASSNNIAILRYEGLGTRLAIMDLTTTSPRFVTSQLLLDIRAGMNWHPFIDQVMVTTIEDNITPTLRIYNPATDASEIFAPNDNQAVRADGVWSPDGNRVVYVAHETITPTVDMPFLAGPLWVTSGNGLNASLLVPEGLNFAPIWDTSQNRILFTRYMTETDTYDLYQIGLSGSPAEKIGPSSEALAHFPFDRQYFQRWSLDGRLWQLPGSSSSVPFTYYRLDNESLSFSVLNSGCETSQPYAVRWAPTNRGVLVACPGGDMFLRWLDRTKEDKPYPNGLFPIWQP